MRLEVSSKEGFEWVERGTMCFVRDDETGKVYNGRIINEDQVGPGNFWPVMEIHPHSCQKSQPPKVFAGTADGIRVFTLPPEMLNRGHA